MPCGRARRVARGRQRSGLRSSTLRLGARRGLVSGGCYAVQRRGELLGRQGSGDLDAVAGFRTLGRGRNEDVSGARVARFLVGYWACVGGIFGRQRCVSVEAKSRGHVGMHLYLAAGLWADTNPAVLIF